MTQDYLKHLFENYPVGDVPKFYWTTDGTAFTELQYAMQYAKTQPDNKVMVLAHGGKLKDAKDWEASQSNEDAPNDDAPNDDAPNEDAPNEDAPSDDVPNEDPPKDEVDYSRLTKAELTELCNQSEIAITGRETKAELINLLEANK